MPGVEGVGDVVLAHLSGPPARGVQEAVVEGEVYVDDQRRDRAEILEHWGQVVSVGGFGAYIYDFADGPLAVIFAVPQPDRGRQVLEADDNAGEAVGL